MEDKHRVNWPLVIIAFVFAAVLASLGIAHNAKQQREDASRRSSIRATTQPQEIFKHAEKRTLIGKNEDAGIELYSDGDYVVLSEGGIETEFTEWNRHIGEKEAKIYRSDFDGDENEDIIILGFEGIEEKSGKDLYGLYVLITHYNNENKKEYISFYTNASNWEAKFNSMITCNLNQLISTPKRMQIVMSYAGHPVEYDENTGIAANSSAVYFALAKKLPDGEYAKVKKLNREAFSFEFDNERGIITARAKLIISYEELEDEHYIGDLVCGITIQREELTIAEKSIILDLKNEAKTPSPIEKIVEPWSHTATENKNGTAGNKVISKLKIDLGFNHEKTETASEIRLIDGDKTNVGAIEKAVITENEVRIYAKKGYSFLQELTRPSKYRATVLFSTVDYDLSQAATIETEDGRQVFVITYDRTYSPPKTNTLKIYLG